MKSNMNALEIRDMNPSSITSGLRIIFIGDNYKAYEKKDGSVELIDVERGYSYYPDVNYEEFRVRVLPREMLSLNWKK